MEGSQRSFMSQELFRSQLIKLADEYERLLLENHHKLGGSLQSLPSSHLFSPESPKLALSAHGSLHKDNATDIQPAKFNPEHEMAPGQPYSSSKPVLQNKSQLKNGDEVEEISNASTVHDAPDMTSKPQEQRRISTSSFVSLQSVDLQEIGRMPSARSEQMTTSQSLAPLRASRFGVLPGWFHPECPEVGAGFSTRSGGGLHSLQSENVLRDRVIVWPLGRFRLIWDFIALLSLLVELWAVPFELIFLRECETPLTLEVLAKCITGFFVIDIALNFNTGYIEGETVVMQRRKIIKTYLKCWFWLDLVATIPFDMIVETLSSNAFSMARASKISKALKTLRYLKIVRVIRLIKTMKQASHLKKHIQILEPIRAVMQPIQVLIFLVLLAHVHGVVWAAMQPDWVAVTSVSIALDRYYQSFCWAYVASTFGVIGDASVHSSAIWTLEVIMASERLGLVALACRQVILNSLACMGEVQDRRTLADLLAYFRRHNVSVQSQIQVMFSLTDIRSARKKEEQYSHLNDLPDHLKQVLQVELWAARVSSLGLILEINTWHHDFVEQLCQMATQQVLPSRCILFHEGSPAESSYCILEGALHATMWHRPDSTPNFTKGMWVGENSLVSPLLRYSATLSTETISSLMVIHGANFQQLLSRLDLMSRFQTFCSDELWKGFCGRCGSLGNHFSDKCPSIAGHRMDVPSRRLSRLSRASSNSGSTLASGFSSGFRSSNSSGRSSTRSRRSSVVNDIRKRFSIVAKPEPLYGKRSIGRGLQRLLQEYDLEHIAPYLMEMHIHDLSDMKNLDLQSLRVMLSPEEALSEEQEAGLSMQSVEAFEERSRRRVHSMLFGNVSRLDHLVFLSHYKMEAGTEAALMRNELEQAIADDEGSLGHHFDNPVFLDAENLRNLGDLQQKIEHSHNVALLLTAGVLSRPWCLVEIVTAWRTGVRILPVIVSRPGLSFSFPDESFYETLRSGKFLTPEAAETLSEYNCDLTDLEEALRSVFHHIALPYSPHKGGGIRKAEIEALLKQCQLKEAALGEQASYLSYSSEGQFSRRASAMFHPKSSLHQLC